MASGRELWSRPTRQAQAGGCSVQRDAPCCAALRCAALPRQRRPCSRRGSAVLCCRATSAQALLPPGLTNEGRGSGRRRVLAGRGRGLARGRRPARRAGRRRRRGGVERPGGAEGAREAGAVTKLDDRKQLGGGGLSQVDQALTKLSSREGCGGWAAGRGTRHGCVWTSDSCCCCHCRRLRGPLKWHADACASSSCRAAWQQAGS